MLNPDISAADARMLLSTPDLSDLAGPNGWTRRRFLQAVGMGVVGGMAVGSFASDVLGFDPREVWAATPIGFNEGVLVNIVFYGGNDGLNTVVPYTNGIYYDKRPGVAIQPGSVLPLDGTFGLHPNLPYLKALWDAGWLGIVHGVGYPNPDLSHFTSMAVWMNGSLAGGPATSGWAGRWLDGQPAASAELAAATIGYSVPLHLQGVARRGLGIPQDGGLFGASTNAHDQLLYSGMKNYSAASGGRGQWHDAFASVLKTQLNVATDVAPVFATTPGGSEFVRKMTVAARLINANLGFRILDLGLDGFDNHDGEPPDHGARMADFDAGLSAFYATLAPYWRNRVTIATMSEFGRTVDSNDSQGTDHGTANVQFVIGQQIRGGHYGAAPSLALPNRWDRLAHTVDFRSTLGTLLDGWLGAGSAAVLNGPYENLGFFLAGPGDPPPNPRLPPVISPPSSPSEFVSMTPLRLFDTRDGTGGRQGALAAAETWSFPIRGQFGVPADAIAVAVNLTAVDATLPTYVTAWPGGEMKPFTSNLNPVPGMAVPNLAIVRFGSGGDVSFYNNSGSVHLLADVVGYFRDGFNTGLSPLVPSRLLDTRTAIGGHPGPLGPGQALDLLVAGQGGVSANPEAVALNVTVTGPTTGSFLTVWPKGEPQPLASSVNMVPGQTVPNMVLARVGADGMVSIFNNSGFTDVVVDVLGCFDGDSNGMYVALSPNRVLDTRDGLGAPKAPVGQTPLLVSLLGKAGVPSDGVSGVMLNVTAVSPTAETYLTIYPSDSERPTASNLNVSGGQVIPNMVLARIGSDGAVLMFNNGGTVDIVADVVGYFTN